jgi:excisionase family DNA binding protein
VAYSVAEVAQALGVSRQTVVRWIAAGDLEAVDLRGPGAKRPKLRVRAAAVEKFLAARALASGKGS